jgi:hypothetical protein
VTALVTAISLPAAAVYGAGAAVDPSVGNLAGIFVGQLLAAVSAGVTAFSALLVVRAAVTLVAGSFGAARLALALQVVAVVGTVEAFMFLPGRQRTVMRALTASGADMASVPPPGWFMGIYALFAGPREPALLPFVTPALVTLCSAVATAVALYLVPARLNAGRAVEWRGGDGTKPLAVAAVRTLSCLLPKQRDRARFVFVLLTIARSRRHSLMVATYFGLGLAVAGTPLLSASLRGRILDVTHPTAVTLALPLALTYVLVLGLRAAFAVPSDVAANWTFRVSGPRSQLDSRPASRLTYLALGVLPVTMMLFAVGAGVWTVLPAMQAAVMHLMTGVVLSELALWRHGGVPFTKARAVSGNAVKVGAIAAAAGLVLVAFRLSTVHAWALTDPVRVTGYVLAGAAVSLVMGWSGRRDAGLTPATFDAPEDHAVTQMKLSEASS